MRRKLYGIFSNMNDAKQALGTIKKESFNLADLTVVFADPATFDEKREYAYEFGNENFGAQVSESCRSWPGMKSRNIQGIGKIQIGRSQCQPENFQKPESCLDESDLAIIGPPVKANQVATIIESDVDLLPKVRFILESHGAFVISGGE